MDTPRTLGERDRRRLETFARGFERRRRFFPVVLALLALLAVAAAVGFGFAVARFLELAAPLGLSPRDAIVTGPAPGVAPTPAEVDLFHAATLLRVLALPALFLVVLPWLAWLVQRQDALLYDLWRATRQAPEDERRAGARESAPGPRETSSGDS